MNSEYTSLADAQEKESCKKITYC